MKRTNKKLYEDIMQDVSNIIKDKIYTTPDNIKSIYKGIANRSYGNLTIGQFFGTLQQSVIVIWRKHLQTNKHSVHVILNDYYNDIIDKVDDLIEAWQSENDIIMDYSNILEGDDYNEVEYLEELKRMTKQGYKLMFSSELESLCDDIVSLINSTLYKLKRLTESRRNYIK